MFFWVSSIAVWLLDVLGCTPVIAPFPFRILSIQSPLPPGHQFSQRPLVVAGSLAGLTQAGVLTDDLAQV